MADSGGWLAVRMWARHDRRRRWKALAALGVLAGVTAGFAMASMAGSRRADTAVARFRSSTHAADAIVFASQVGHPHPDWSALRSRPEVADLAVWSLMFGTIEGDPDGTLFVAGDGFLDRVGKPKVLQGRMWDPAAPDEVVVTPAIAKMIPPGEPVLGHELSMQTYGADQGDGADAPTGPVVQLKVVGVVETINYFMFVSDQVFVGPGFLAAHRADVQLAENADVVLRGGAADIPALQRDVNETVAEGTPVLDLHDASRRVDTTVSVERAALLLLAIAIAVAGGLLVAQALVRSAAVVADEALALRAVGLTRRDLAAGALVSHALTIVLAVAVAGATAVAASQLFPVGLSRQIDPDPGVHADWFVLGVGIPLLAALLVGGTGLVAWRAARQDQPGLRHPSRLVASLRASAPVTVGIGTTMALDPGAGRTRVSVRPALVGAIVGVLGVIGALTIQHGVDDALAHPERAGVTWDATVFPPPTSYQPHGVDRGFLDAVAASAPGGSAETVASRFVVRAGSIGVAAFSLVDQPTSAAPISFSITHGRAPAGDDELALGPKTAQDLGVGVGDTVEVGDAQLPMRVVGLALFPPDVHAEFDEGLWVTGPTFEKLAPVVQQENLFQGPERYVLLRYPHGTDKAAATAQLGEVLSSQGSGAAPADIPVELQNLRNVRTLPLLLAAFLGLLAIAAISHVLVTSSYRRRREFAVLRAIGFNRRSTRLVLNAQGSTIAVVGLLVGVPLGIATGRTAWHWVADKVPLEDVPPFALIAVLVVLPVTVLIVNALALWPGRVVARLRPAELLRTE